MLLQQVLVKAEPADDYDTDYRGKRALSGSMSSAHDCELACMTSELPDHSSEGEQVIKKRAVLGFLVRSSRSSEIF
jgi:hypothetical protein